MARAAMSPRIAAVAPEEGRGSRASSSRYSSLAPFSLRRTICGPRVPGDRRSRVTLTPTSKPASASSPADAPCHLVVRTSPRENHTTHTQNNNDESSRERVTVKRAARRMAAGTR